MDERWVTAGDMAEALKKAKLGRKNRLSSFTRKQKHLNTLIDSGTDGKTLEKHYEELSQIYKELEKSHEDLCLLLEEDSPDASDTYMDSPSESLAEVHVKVSKAVATADKETADANATAERDRQFKGALASFKASIEIFGNPATRLQTLSSEKKISCSDMRLELSKIEAEMSKLAEEKNKLLNLDPAADLTTVNEQFNARIVDAVDNCKKIALEYLKDDVSPRASETGGGSDRRLNFSTTKRETVMLPKFSGDEKTAFLAYPVWKQQWDSHIQEYEPKYRATMLLNHLDAKALEQIIGLETEYDKAIAQLEKYYNDAKKIIKACLDEIRAHPVIHAFDYKALVSYKKCLINNYTRLTACGLDHEMSNTAALGVLVRKLPIQEAVKWQEYLSEQDKAAQTKPFPSFMAWLEKAGASWELLAASGTGSKVKSSGAQVHHSFYAEEENADATNSQKPCFKCGDLGHWKRNCPKNTPNRSGKHTGGGKDNKSQKDQKTRDPPKHRKHHCALHKDAPGKWCSSWSCTALKYTPVDERIKLMQVNGDCQQCCGDCPKSGCLSKIKRTCGGNKEGRGCGTSHIGHELWCRNAKLCFSTLMEPVLSTEVDSNDGVLLQLMKIPSVDSSQAYETVLWDSACTDIFVRHEHARKMGFPYREKRLRVTTLGGQVQEIDGVIYDCKIKDQKGKILEFSAHGLEEVTGNLGNPLSKDVMSKMFPDIVGGHKLSGATTVDYLIGLSKASWQPQRIQKALCGGDFWLWENRFGTCVGGSHPMVNSFTHRSDSIYTVLKVVTDEIVQGSDFRIPTCSALATKAAITDSQDFFETERLGTVVEPRCGNCRCGTCPIPGSRYSFREESELKLIEEGLTYDEVENCWTARYPYLYPKELLKGDKNVAVKSMLATERMLSKKGDWGEVYNTQIMDMVKRNVARKIPEDELNSYEGHINYLPHLAALNPKSSSTPVRIVFDASRSQGGGPSLNAILAKGPDRYLNNLAGVILNFRNGREAAKGDVSKMYNCVRLVEEDAWVQCFLWRDLDLSKSPETYQVTVNNIGIKPAGAIATLALRKSAEKYSQMFPITVSQLKDKSYVDDLGMTAGNMSELKERTSEADIILSHANMRVKQWTYSKESQMSIPVGAVDVVQASSLEGERMLGVMWEPLRDVFKFSIKINLSPMKNKSRLEPDLCKEDLLSKPPRVISRRQYYSLIQSLFDPIGLLSPIMLTAKLLLRKTWEGECAQLKWDDPLPETLTKQMIDYFVELFDLETLEFSRSIWPDQPVVGKPELICFSDGSMLAFGAVLYIRWRLESGEWWTSLVTSKSKIAPKNRLTIPRLELNGAVLSKRLKEFMISEVDLEFENVYHLVDSSTVLGYVHKEDSKLKPFEGIRVSEVQTAGKFVNGRLFHWSWIEGENNPADWATKPRTVSDLVSDGFWQRGPAFLRQEYETWPIKHDFKVDGLEGELQPRVHFAFMVADNFKEDFNLLLERVSTAKKLFRVISYILKWVPCGKESSLVHGSDQSSLFKARTRCIRLAQSFIEKDILDSTTNAPGEKIHGKYRRLAPFLDQEGIWRVGLRMREYTPFTFDNQAPALIPNDSRLAILLMEEAHGIKHSGVEETTARFRLMGFWTVQAGKLAKTVRSRCVICRYLDKRTMNQAMGNVPRSQLVSPAAWGHVEVDLFGPFLCKSDVNKRASLKVWGAVFVDRCSGAVHSDVVMNYSAEETIKTVKRFAALRGWPVSMYSDPGSQLESSAGLLQSWWETLRSRLEEFGSNVGFSWKISPADSPWRQGKCEVRVKVLKRLLTLSVGLSKLTPVELQTALFEAANLCNERPVGIHRTPKVDGSFKVLTPNCLILGRSLNVVPDDTNLGNHLKKSDRFELIQQVTSDFWSRWVQEVTPESIVRQRWHETGRNLQKGDIVLIHEKSAIKGGYTLGIVEEVKSSCDTLVRSCIVGYTIPNGKDHGKQYTGGKRISVSRSIQRLTLLLPVEEQHEKLDVIGNQVLKKVN